MPEFTVPSFINFLIVVLAAMAAGRSFGQAAGRMPTGGERLGFGLASTLAAMVINLVFLAGLLVWYGFAVSVENLSALLAGGDTSAGAGFLAIVLGIALVIGAGLGALGLGSGAKQALKKMQAA